MIDYEATHSFISFVARSYNQLWGVDGYWHSNEGRRHLSKGSPYVIECGNSRRFLTSRIGKCRCNSGYAMAGILGGMQVN